MPIQELSHTKILKQNMIRQVLYIISTRIFLAEILGCIIFSVGERKNSLPTLNFYKKIGTHIKSRV